MTEADASAVRRGGGWVTFLGAVMIFAGIASMLAPLASGVAVIWILGGIVIGVGVLSLLNAFAAESSWLGAGDFWMGLLYILVGVMLWMNPIAGLKILTLVAAIFLLLRGMMQIAVAFQLKPAQGWGWVLFSGAAALLLGILLFAKWPLSGLWAVGVFLGVELLFSGWTLVFAGRTLRDAAKAMKGGAA